MQDDETPNPGAEAGDADEIEMPSEPASASHARDVAKVAQWRAEIAAEAAAVAADRAAETSADAAGGEVIVAHARAGDAYAALTASFESHEKYRVAEIDARDKAAALDAASDKAQLARAEAYVAEWDARNAYTKAIAEGDPAAIAEAKQALSAAELLHKTASGVDDALRITAEDAAEAAKMADTAEDAAEARLGWLYDANVKAEGLSWLPKLLLKPLVLPTVMPKLLPTVLPKLVPKLSMLAWTLFVSPLRN